MDFEKKNKKLSYRRDSINTSIITPFKVIQGNRFWYQAKARLRLPISD